MKRALPDPGHPILLDAWLDPSNPAFKMYRVCMRPLASVGRKRGRVSLPEYFFKVTPSFPRA